MVPYRFPVESRIKPALGASPVADGAQFVAVPPKLKRMVSFVGSGLLMGGEETPVPVRLTVCGLSAALSARFKVADSDPTMDGVNATPTEHALVGNDV